MAKKRRYSDEERATALAALAANGGDLERTGRELGIPVRTLRHWNKGTAHPEAARDAEEKKGPLADYLEKIAYQIADGMTTAKIKKAGLQQQATSLAIVIDKMRLLREQSTSITDDARLTDDERTTRLKQLAERIRQRRAGTADANGDGGIRPVDPATPTPNLEPPTGAASGSV